MASQEEEKEKKDGTSPAKAIKKKKKKIAYWNINRKKDVKDLKAPRRKKKIETDDPYAKMDVVFSLHPNDLLNLRRIMFANSLPVQAFLEHVVDQLINQNPKMLEFVSSAQLAKAHKDATYGVRYNKSYNSETEAEMLYKLLAEKEE